MTRQAFLVRLREGLRGLPPQTVADIIGDYEAHFADGAAEGRSEEEVADALGNPDRLAREVRAESSVTRWRDERSPSSAAAAIFAVLGLGALDILFLLPILLSIAITLFALFIVAVVMFFVGVAALTAGPFTDPPGGPAAAVLAGIGIMAGAASAGAILTIISIGFMNAMVWYGRLHYRLLKPALEA